MRNLLDSMFPRFKVNKKNIDADSTLSQAEQKLLLQIVTDFEAQNEKYDYRSALDSIAKIMLRYNNVSQEVVKDGKTTKIAIQPKTLPFLIKQVLFYMAVACKIYGLCTQAAILDELENRGISISHNFFSSKMPVTPVAYINMKTKKYLLTPNNFDSVLSIGDAQNVMSLPTNYVGQKHEELAVAIKNLVYQAGKYDLFADVFGGSGAASVAVAHNKDANYVYNEKNIAVYNLFEVMTDNTLHLELIDELQALQADLSGKCEWLPFDMLNEEAESYFKKKKGKRTNKEVSAVNKRLEELDLSFDDIVKYMESVRENVLNQSDDFTFEYDDISYTKEMLLEDIFPDKDADTRYTPGYACFMSFCKNFNVVQAYSDKYMGAFGLNTLYGETYVIPKKQVKKNDVWDTIREYEQFRFYRYFAYFDNLLTTPDIINRVGKVRAAVAKIYTDSFKTRGKTGISSILRMLMASGGKNKKSNDAENFLKRDFNRIICDVHKEIANIICELDDCINIIKKYESKSEAEIKVKHNNPLFYVDSPYAATLDYKDKASNVDNFTDKNMSDLIDNLALSENKFIFSCRAVKGSSNGSKTTDKLKELNKVIFSTVFEKFLVDFIEKDKPLYVLAIEKEGSLADLVKKNMIAEVMITNYEICDFVDDRYSDVNFKVYSFTDFMDVLVKNANV